MKELAEAATQTEVQEVAEEQEIPELPEESEPLQQEDLTIQRVVETASREIQTHVEMIESYMQTEPMITEQN